MLLAAGRLEAAQNPCASCHEEQVAAVGAGVHARVAKTSERFCVACHGPADRHMESGEAKDILGPQALAQLDEATRAESCLSCHQASKPGWQESAHARAGVSCWSCHEDVWHRPRQQSEEASLRPCASCHGQVSAEFRRAWHHPVAEGAMSCASCHELHGRQDESELAVQRCAGCHQQAAGPFLFPHRATDEEGCIACHAPHGTVNRSLLRSSGNGLCVRCHLQSNFPGVGKVPHNFNLAGGGRCFDCHSDVHGSNASGLLAPRLER